MSHQVDLTHSREATTPPCEAVRESDNGTSRFENLAADGRLRPARRDLCSLGTPSDAPHEISISQALDELRSGT